MIEELIARVLMARNAAHVQYLTTTSYAERLALNAFCMGVIKAVDALTVNYIGMFGGIGEVAPLEQPDSPDMRSFLQDEVDWIDTNRDTICNDSGAIGALVDALAGVYTHTVYRLGLQ